MLPSGQQNIITFQQCFEWAATVAAGTNLCQAQSELCDKHFHLQLSFASQVPAQFLSCKGAEALGEHWLKNQLLLTRLKVWKEQQDHQGRTRDWMQNILRTASLRFNEHLHKFLSYPSCWQITFKQKLLSCAVSWPKRLNMIKAEPPYPCYLLFFFCTYCYYRLHPTRIPSPHTPPTPLPPSDFLEEFQISSAAPMRVSSLTLSTLFNWLYLKQIGPLRDRV